MQPFIVKTLLHHEVARQVRRYNALPTWKRRLIHGRKLYTDIHKLNEAIHQHDA